MRSTRRPPGPASTRTQATAPVASTSVTTQAVKQRRAAREHQVPAAARAAEAARRSHCPATPPQGRPRRPPSPGLARRPPPDLAARRLGDRARGREHDAVRGDADGVGHPAGHRAPQRGQLRLAGEPRLGHDHEALRPALGIRRAERGDASGAHAGDGPRGRFRLVGVEVVAALDDQVLRPAGEEELAIREVAAVAGVEPAVVAGDRPRRGGIAIVPAHRRRPAEANLALVALRGRGPAGVDDLQLVTRQRLPAGDEAQRLPAGGRHRVPRGLKGRPIDPVDTLRAPDGRRRQPDRALGESVDGEQGRRIEAMGRETVDEAANRLRQHRLGPVEQHPQPSAGRVPPAPPRECASCTDRTRSSGPGTAFPRCASRVRSQRTGRERKASGDMRASGIPKYRLPSQAPISPMS